MPPSSRADVVSPDPIPTLPGLYMDTAPNRSGGQGVALLLLYTLDGRAGRTHLHITGARQTPGRSRL